MAESRPIDYAKSYAANGWHVMPCWWVDEEIGRCACGDPSCTRKNWGKHPLQKLVPSGLKQATTRQDLITLWWEAYPQANVAIVCEPSGLLVIDIDPRNGGDATFDALDFDHMFPPTTTALTGGGGRHLLYSDAQLRDAGTRPRGKLGPGVDVKWSGYILAAPSNHASGGTYSWSDLRAPAELGQDLLAAVVQSNGGAPDYQAGTDVKPWSGAVDFNEIFTGVAEGGRHQAFVSYAASLRARRVKLPEAELLISAAWSQVDEGEHPFPITEALRIVHDTYATRPEGFTDEVQLEQYAGWLKGLGTDQDTVSSESPVPTAQSAGGTGMNGTTLNGTNGHTPSANETGSRELWTPGDYARTGTFASMLLTLPPELEPLKTAMLKISLQEEARTLVTRIKHLTEFEEPVLERLDDLIAQDFAEPDWVVHGLHEHGTNSSLTASYKTGKTTLQLNLIRSLADGTPFLDAFEVKQMNSIVFFNYELTRATFARWAGRVGMSHPERVHVVNLRGMRLELGLEQTREWIAGALRSVQADFWIADPLARAFYGDENSNSELKLWTDAVDEIKHRGECPNFQVTLHMGRGEQNEGEERARGATRIDDWVDTRWILMRSGDARFFSAKGRDVNEEEEGRERMLTFDRDTWRMSVNPMTALNRAGHRDFTEQERVVTALRELQAVSQLTGVRISRLRAAMRGNTNSARIWVDNAVASGTVQTDGSLYWIGDPVFNPVNLPTTTHNLEGL